MKEVEKKTETAVKSSGESSSDGSSALSTANDVKGTSGVKNL